MQTVRARDRRSERNMKNEGQAKEKMKAKKEVVLREKQRREISRGCRYVTKSTSSLSEVMTEMQCFLFKGEQKAALRTKN